MILPWRATGPAQPFRAQLSRMHDGDSFWLLVDTKFGQRYEPELRLVGVHAPELRQPGGLETTDFVNGWLAGVSQIVDSMGRTRRWPFWIECVQTTVFEPDLKMTFTRYLATVWPYDQRRVEDSLNYQVNTFLSGHPEWPPGQ